MHILLQTARFSGVYLARYWPRFTLGIVLAFVFGASNGLFMGSVYILLTRLDEPKHVQQITEKAREAKEKKEQGESPIAPHFQTEV